MKKAPIIILGGDKRQKYVYDVLSKDGYDCSLVNGFSENIDKIISEHRYIILPFPATKDNKSIYCMNKDFNLQCDKLCELLNNRQIVFGGNLGKNLTDLLERKNIVYHDLSNNEDFLVYNAFLTAQGALKLLLDNTEEDLTHKKVLITGFGRIGKATALLFNRINLSVTVCARKESQISLAECLGFNTIKYNSLNEALNISEFIFNTVPERVFNSMNIENIKEGAVYFELASSPYGVNEADLTIRGHKYVDGGSLPGKYTPRAAGEYIAKNIEKLI